MSFLAGHVRDNSVDTDNCENQAEETKHGRQHSPNLVKQHSIQSVERLIHRFYVEQRKLRRKGLNHPLDFRDHRFGGTSGAKLENLEGVAELMLEERDVEHWVDLAGHSLEASVSGNSDHFDGMFVVSGHFEVMANGIRVGPKLLGHSVAYDGYILCILTVGIREGSSVKQRNSHGPKIITGNRGVQGGRTGWPGGG